MTDTDTDSKVRAAAEARLNEVARMASVGAAGVVVHLDDSTTEPRPLAPAWYDTKTWDVHVHVDEAGVPLDDATDLSTKSGATVMGLLVHELAHSSYSTWLTPELHAKVASPTMAVVLMFEELRIEARAVNRNTSYRNWLRASLGLIVAGAKTHAPKTRYDAARSWLLVAGRAITTVTTPAEVEWMNDAARTVLGDDDVDYLTDILQEAIAFNVHGVGPDRLIELAEEWLAVVGLPEREDEGEGCGVGDDATKGEGGDGTGGEGGEESDDETDGDREDGDRKGHGGGEKVDGDDAEKGEADDESKPEGKGSSEAGIANSTDAPDPDAVADDDPDASPLLSEDEAELMKDVVGRTLDEVDEGWNAGAPLNMADADATAKETFGAKRGHYLREEKPDARHHVAVRETSKALEELVVPAITKVSVAANLPPGRLRTREAVRASAERAMGKMVTAKPWEATKRRHTSTRPIVVGIATDVSGSMKWAENAVADFAYTWANAGQRIGARTAAVTFGDRVDVVAAPGEVLSAVRTKSSDGGTEVADRALAALDGVLKFSHSNGAAKLLVIVSDGHLVISRETERVVERLKDFKRGGTTVIWVTPEWSGTVRKLQKAQLAEVVQIDLSRSYYSGGAAFKAIQEAVLTKLRSMAH